MAYFQCFDSSGNLIVDDGWLTAILLGTLSITAAGSKTDSRIAGKQVWFFPADVNVNYNQYATEIVIPRINVSGSTLSWGAPSSCTVSMIYGIMT